MASEPRPDETQGIKLGLALSGGGFRAAFFHIGVLARMAELDLLRHVQVISTVSGGSVVGALYYLHARNLLRGKADRAIQPSDYVEIVDAIQRDFQGAVCKNLRMRTFGNLYKNLKMMCLKGYSRSDRIAELYTRHLYAPVVEEALRPNVPFSGLKIQPMGEGAGFHPVHHNAGRAHKVPVLLINATTLNTGHNFQFTATWMGEPPAQRQQGRLDKNVRLRRVYCDGRDPLPEKYLLLPLGVAVAASTAVPGIFPPLPLTGLYGGITPQLVDGGVHDNQGTEGLLDNRCTHLIVSDASGQMNDVDEPGSRALSVLKRTNDILMSRVRTEEYAELTLRKAAGEIQDFAFLHLKEDLQQREVTWAGGQDKLHQQGPDAGVTSYGVSRKVQRLLADLRTDLDSFTEVEANALMADGYLMAECLIGPHFVPGGAGNARAHDWDFLNMKPFLAAGGEALERQLKAGSAQAFKVWTLLRWLNALWVAPLLWLLGYLAYARLLWGLGGVAITLYALVHFLPRRLPWIRALRRLPVSLVFAPLAWLVTGLHLSVFDRLFLWQGEVKRLG